MIAHEVTAAPNQEPEVHLEGIEEVVADKGYHSGAVLTDLNHVNCRSCIPEPERGRRHWNGKAEERDQLYGNRRRMRRDKGKQLQRQRSELTERSMAHLYETGAMRRLHLRGRDNIQKRLLIHAGGFNRALVLRNRFGIGKPRGLQGLCFAALRAVTGHSDAG